jgi:hypothetical protein
MPYETVFEISRKPFPWWFPACGLAVVAFGWLLAKRVIRSRSASGTGRKWVGWSIMGIGLLWTICFASVYSKYHRYNSAYRSGQYSVVEGIVEDFRPMPHEGCECECFRVKAVTFCYSDEVVSAGFNQSASHGGPIRDGLPVRIAHRDNQILKLEIISNRVVLPTN